MVGKILNDTKNIFDNNIVVKKYLKRGEKIEKHNHEGYEVFFIVIDGAIVVRLNDDEKHSLFKGDILHFDGVNFIEADCNNDVVVYVFLVRK